MSNQIFKNSSIRYFDTQQSTWTQSSGQQIINNGDTVTVVWNVQSTGTKEIVGISVFNGIFTVTQTGFYTISCSIVIAADIVGIRRCWLVKNGSPVRLGEDLKNAAIAPNNSIFNVNYQSIINAGQTFQIQVSQTGSANLNLIAPSDPPPADKSHTQITITKTGA